MSNVLYFGSLCCCLEEERYLTLVEKDLDCFSKKISVNSVLIFPPLSSRYRFLIHKVVERWSKLKSCSIGSEPNRRTVVYFEKLTRTHKAQQSTNNSKLETKQAPDGTSSRGRGRGRGVRVIGQNQHDNLRNSPTASRRPAQALYTPGAFSKHRKNDQGSRTESPENVGTKNTLPKSLTKTEPVNEKSEISKTKQVDKSNAKSESLLKDDEDKRNGMVKDEKNLENNSNKSYVGSPISSSVENRSRIVKGDNSSSDIKGKRIDHVDVVVTSESQPDCINSDTVTNSLQSHESVGQSNNFDGPVNSNVDNEIMSEKCVKQKEVCSTSEVPPLDDTDETILTSDHIEVPLKKELVSSSSESDRSKILPNKSCGYEKSMNASKEKGDASKEEVDNRKNMIEIERQLAETKLDDTVDSVTERLGNNECMSGRESSVNIHNNKTNVKDSVSEDDKISIGNNANFVDSQSEGNAEAQGESKRKQNLNVKDDKIALEDNESMVDGGCEEMIETQSKEKLQCKPDDLKDKEDKVGQGNNGSIENKEIVETESASNDDNKAHETIENNESMVVDSQSRKQVRSHSHSKSKRQSKKEEKAKKKEDKLKRKQVKTKSEKTVKEEKSEGEEKRTAKDIEVNALGNKEKNNKKVKSQQGKEEQAGSEETELAKGGEVPDVGKKGKSSKEVKIQEEKEKQALAGDEVIKVVRESKDTLLKSSVSDCQSLNQEDKASEEDSAEEDWEKTWNDDGECLDEDMLAELNEEIGTKNVQAVKPQFDYLSFKPNDIVLDNGVFDHVVELYDFPPEFKNHDLINALSNFQKQGFDIHWVDDTHALAVFSNHKLARQAIEQCSNPMLKLRPLYEGIQKSKLKAKRNVDVLQPYKERPKTTKLVANRLVAGALGMRSKMSKEERQLEREKIKAEREKKLNKEKQKKDLWESDDI